MFFPLRSLSATDLSPVAGSLNAGIFLPTKISFFIAPNYHVFKASLNIGFVLALAIVFIGGLLNDGFTRPQAHAGWIEVIVGCMFSGKTEELIKQMRRANIARQRCQTFKPHIDQRYSVEDVASHDQNRLSAYPVTEAKQILELVQEATSVVAIDEGQFFNADLLTVATELAESGKRVIIAGLDTDWRGRPFGPMPQLMAIAEVVRKQHAICRVCGGPASRTQRLTAAQADILVASTDAYEARCRTHFDPNLGTRTLTDKAQNLTLTDL